MEYLPTFFSIYEQCRKPCSLCFPTTAGILKKLLQYTNFVKVPVCVDYREKMQQCIVISERLKVKDLTQGYLKHIQTIAKTYNPNNVKNKKIVINRKTKRIIEPKLLKHLKALGFVEYFLENMSLEEQAKLYNSASHIVCAHGSALANIVFCRTNTKIIEINPGYNAYCFQELAKKIQSENKIKLNCYVLIPKEIKDTLIPANKNDYINKHKIIKTGLNEYYIIRDVAVFTSKTNKNVRYVTADINDINKLI